VPQLIAQRGQQPIGKRRKKRAKTHSPDTILHKILGPFTVCSGKHKKESNGLSASKCKKTISYEINNLTQVNPPHKDQRKTLKKSPEQMAKQTDPSKDFSQ